MPIALKVLLGCAGVVVFGIVAIAVVFYFAGGPLKDELMTLVGGMEEQMEATETLERLAREHPFRPPEDGVATPDQAETFVAVTDALWAQLGDSLPDLVPLIVELPTSEQLEESQDADPASAFRAANRLMRLRPVLAQVLDEHDVSETEYVWTGLALHSAYRALSDPEARTGIAAANLELARQYRHELAELEGREDRVGKGALVALAAYLSFRPESSEALGLDTLNARMRALMGSE